MTWHERARCATDPHRPHPEAFFPLNGEEGAAAKEFCFQCPVIAECFDFACTNRVHGIYGGTTAGERKRIGFPPAYCRSPWEEQDRAIRIHNAKVLRRLGWPLDAAAEKYHIHPREVRS